MITPLDIENKEFKKKLRGYSPKDVDVFFEEIVEDYEKLYKENIELKDKVNMLADQIRQYNTLEETLKSTLIVAQSTADEVTTSARKKAENIIDDAEANSRDLKYKAREDVKDIKEEYEILKKEIFIFKTRFKSFIEAQLLSLEDFYLELDENENMSKDNEEVEGFENHEEVLKDIHTLGAK